MTLIYLEREMKLKTNYFLRTGLFLLLFLSCSVSFGQDISEELSDFNEVKIFNGVEVTLIPAEENRIVISGFSKDKVKYTLVENRLEVRLSLENIWSQDNTKIAIYFRKLQVIDANENSVVEVNGEMLGSNLVFRAQEGSTVRARVDALKQSSKAVTGGQIYLEGKVRDQQVDINTGGQFFGRKLRSENTEVSITAGGRAEVYASNYCRANAKLGGTIEIYGNPDDIDRKTSIGGKIIEMN